MKPFLLIAAFLLFSFYSKSQVVLDSTFSGNGWDATDIAPGMNQSDMGYCMAIQPDGKIVVVGTTEPTLTNFDWAFVRYNTDGSVDNTFGNNGFVVINFDTTGATNSFDFPTKVLIQPDGKIIASGQAQLADTINAFAVVRLNSDGSFDTGFGPGFNGIVLTNIIAYTDMGADMALQPDGKIVMCGSSYHSYTNSSDGDIAVVRFDEWGNLDNTFSNDGKVTTALTQTTDEEITSLIELLPDGSMLVAGTSQGSDKTLVIKYTSTGVVDNTFGTGGVVYIEPIPTGNNGVIGLEVLQSGKIFVQAGIQTMGPTGLDYYFARLNADGSFDNTFGTNGISMHDLNSLNNATTRMALQPDEKPVFAIFNTQTPGYYLARHNTDGTPDTSFNHTGYAYFTLGTQLLLNNTALQSDGKILICGYANPTGPLNLYIARFYPGDTTTIPTGISLNNLAETIKLYPNPLQQTETLKYTLVEAEQMSISLIDSQGKLVATFIENEKQGAGAHEEVLNLPPNLPNGTYFIQIASPKGTVSIKTVK